VSLFSERESHAVYFLQGQEMTRFDAVNYISHGITKSAGSGTGSVQPPAPTMTRPPSAQQKRSRSAGCLLQQPQSKGNRG